MDVDSLRTELEEQVAKIPHEDAPDGFRDRFDHVAECLKSGEGGIPQAALEGQLQQIRDEAEAAAKAGGAEAAAPKVGAPAKRAAPAAAAPAPAESAAPAPPDSVAPASVPPYGIAAGILVVVLIAAFFYFR